jgi:uncharacterized membrane protein
MGHQHEECDASSGTEDHNRAEHMEIFDDEIPCHRVLTGFCMIAFIAHTAATVVIADMPFTASAVILQPITGGMLMALSATSLDERWLAASLGLYVVAGLFWIPVIFMQIEMRDLARTAVAQNTPLSTRYFMLYRRWFAFGIPGFGSVVAILWLMIAKPSF